MLRSLPDAGCTLYIGTKQFGNVEKLAKQGLMKSNVRVIGEVANDKDADNAFILENCSYYFHCAREPQATTILENCARGLVPLITARSGFSCPDAIYLSDDDPAENQRIVASALAMSDEEYAERSRAVRMHVRLYHSWDRICREMYVAMRALIAGQDVPRRGDQYS
jgi:glycosyltransferase involved in cell wall biosynthesis